MANLIISLANQIEVSYCYECSSDIFICSVCICYAVIPLSAVWFDMDKKKSKIYKKCIYQQDHCNLSECHIELYLFLVCKTPSTFWFSLVVMLLDTIRNHLRVSAANIKYLQIVMEAVG